MAPVTEARPAPEAVHHVLLLSTSTTFFSESGPENSLLGLTEAALRRNQPGLGWECAGELLYVTPDMPPRARKLVEKHQPDVVIVRPTSQAFMHDDVVSAIRNRWPRLYRLSLRIADQLRRLSGGERFGGAGARSLVFRVPRWVAVRLIGVAPRVPVEDAAAYVRETLDSLLRLESPQVVCEVSAGNSPSQVRAEEHARRVSYFLDSLRSHCASRLIPFADAGEILRDARLGWEVNRDQYHYTLAPRVVEAEALAALVARTVLANGADVPDAFSRPSR